MNGIELQSDFTGTAGTGKGNSRLGGGGMGGGLEGVLIGEVCCW